MAVFYLTVSSGMAVNIHYCMGKISSVTFGHEKDHNDGTCNKCGMNKTESHCCNDESQFIKLTDAQQLSKEAATIALFSVTLPETITALQDPLQGFSIEPYITYSTPPPPVLNKIYLAVNVFRI
jgi:hypothetical protein